MTPKGGRTTHPWEFRAEMIGAIIRLAWENEEIMGRIRTSYREGVRSQTMALKDGNRCFGIEGRKGRLFLVK